MDEQAPILMAYAEGFLEEFLAKYQDHHIKLIKPGFLRNRCNHFSSVPSVEGTKLVLNHYSEPEVLWYSITFRPNHISISSKYAYDDLRDVFNYDDPKLFENICHYVERVVRP